MTIEREALAPLVARKSGWGVVFADFASAVKAHPGGEFESKMRPDGAHIDLKYAPELVTWLDQMIRDVYVAP